MGNGVFNALCAHASQVGFGWTNGVVLDLLHQGYLPL
jgi:neutral trehalase